MTGINDVDGLTAADIMHRHLATLPATATLDELQQHFAGSARRRLAIIVDGPRYLGSLTPADVADVDGTITMPELASGDLLVRAGDPAAVARDLALAHPSQRVPVVDDDATLVGIVAINRTRDGFCGT